MPFFFDWLIAAAGSGGVRWPRVEFKSLEAAVRTLESSVVVVTEEDVRVDVGDDAEAVAAVEVDDDPPEGDAIDGEEVTCADRKGRAQDAESCVAASWLSKYVSTGWSFPNGSTTAVMGLTSGVPPEGVESARRGARRVATRMRKYGSRGPRGVSLKETSPGLGRVEVG